MSNNITITGKLISARKYDFKDESSGRKVEGTSIHIAIPQTAEEKSSDFFGFNIKKMSGDTALFATINPEHIDKRVDVLCNLRPTTDGFKAIPLTVNLAK